MTSTPLPETYDQWRHCITVECGIPLTHAFVTQRLKVWRDTQREETVRFRRHYGDAHWQATIRWFEQAERELTECHYVPAIVRIASGQ